MGTLRAGEGEGEAVALVKDLMTALLRETLVEGSLTAGSTTVAAAEDLAAETDFERFLVVAPTLVDFLVAAAISKR